MSLERYREAVPDWEAFRAALERPEPTTFRVRTGRISTEELTRTLEDQGFRLEELEGLPDFRQVVEAPFKVTNTLEHWLGLLYVQQASTGLAAPALGCRPGDRVLDMCAAPGGKTGHLADLMDDRGSLVAADVKEKRIRALLGNLYRTAHASVLVVSADGRSFPRGASFDRILVDAPCTAEGNVRRKGGRWRETDPEFRRFISGVQGDLLRRAAELLRPGGVLVYCTCTFAPEENEAVVDALLRDPELGPGLDVEPLRPDAPHAPGLVAFRDTTFDPRLEGACRIYPHHLDSGGLFLARLRRRGASPGGDGGSRGGASFEDGGVDGGGEEGRPSGWSPVPPVFPGDEGGGEAGGLLDEGLRRLAVDFHVPQEEIRAMRWMVRGDSIWMHRCPEWPLEAWEGQGGWRMISLGLRAMVDDGRGGVRPTNDFLLWLERAQGEGVVDLGEDECLRLLRGEKLPAPGRENGFVILRLEGRVVGRGLVVAEALRHEVPKARARRLRDILERRPE